MVRRNEPEQNVSLVDVLRKYPQVMPPLEKLFQLIEAQSRASEESARQRRPEQQLREQAFVNAIRADPDGGPKRWSAAVAQQEFGRSVALRHVESARALVPPASEGD